MDCKLPLKINLLKRKQQLCDPSHPRRDILWLFIQRFGSKPLQQSCPCNSATVLRSMRRRFGSNGRAGGASYTIATSSGTITSRGNLLLELQDLACDPRGTSTRRKLCKAVELIYLVLQDVRI